MSFRAWLSLITFALIAIILFFSRHELHHAWMLLGQVNIWILLLLLPLSALSYYAAGEMIFEYLRSKNSISKVPRWQLLRIALELNFVNHVLPSGGVSGISYTNWRLGQYGVTSGRATMAQVVRYVMGFAAFVVLLAIAVLLVTIDGSVNRWIILVSSMLIGGMVTIVVGGIYVLASEKRLLTFASWCRAFINRAVRTLSMGKVKELLDAERMTIFLVEMHHDFLSLRRDVRILKKPFIWGIIYTLADMSLFLIAFWALGSVVNPAPILIAYGVASIAGFFVVTPGGAGAYEALMVGFLALAGISSAIAIAGILLTRVIVLLATVLFGYVSYQHAILKYGKGEMPAIKLKVLPPEDDQHDDR